MAKNINKLLRSKPRSIPSNKFVHFSSSASLNKTVLNYRVIIEKEYDDKGKVVYSATCPTLGVFDYGNSIDKVLAGIKDGIEGVVEFLTEQRREIPVDHPEEKCLCGAVHGLLYDARAAIVENVALGRLGTQKGEVVTMFDPARIYADARGIAQMYFFPTEPNAD